MSVFERLVVFNNHRLWRTDTVKQFLARHESQILGVLNGWDRVRFRGTLRVLSCVPGLFVWMLEQKVLLPEFAGERGPEEYRQLANAPGQLQQAMTTYSTSDVMRFRGQKTTASGSVQGPFSGEVVSDLKTRPEGVRIKHRVGSNSIKMYDKQGSVLRVETTINDISDFKVHRASEDDPQGSQSLRKMRKGVVELPARTAASQAANNCYLESLAGVETAAPLSQVLDQLAQPVTHNGHRSRGLRPLTGADAQLAQHLLRGEFSRHGFRNRDLREPLFGPKSDPADIRRDSAKVSRLLRLFRDHSLIDRVKATHRDQLPAPARRTLPGLLAIRNTNKQRLNELVV